MEGGPPGFAQDYTCPALLGNSLGAVRNRLPGFHRLWRAIPGRFTLASCIPYREPHNPGGASSPGLASSPFAHRYLGNLG